MPSTRDIRRRIKSVKGTAQITKAMQMVASSKMRKAQQAALNGRPFAALAQELMDHAVHGASDFTHPLLEKREGGKKGLIVVSTDKGLCGALNSNLLREAARYDAANTRFLAVGKKAAQYLARTRRDLAAEFTYRDTPTFSECQAIADAAADLFLKGEVSQVDVLYTRFINTLSQKPEICTVLPMGNPVEEAARSGEAARSTQPETAAPGPAVEYLFEPSATSVIEALLTYELTFQVAQLLLEAKASEHSARMVAMKNATDNAQQLIKDLTLEYNKLRQSNITKELLEIATAQMALG
jgi:F-type H+-transporting ATPase subunit gamma